MDANDTIECPWCKAEQLVHESLLGALANLFHFRCKYCGGDFSKTAPIQETDDGTDDTSDS